MRLAALFVEERPARPASPATAPRARTAVVLGLPAGVAGLGAVLGAALRREAGAPATVVLDWCPSTPAGGRTDGIGLPGGRVASRLARSLTAREVPVRPVGRLVRGALPADDAGAAAAVRRAAAAVPPEIPLVVALGGARGPALDGLLGAVDVVVVAGAPADAGTAAACAGAARLAACVVVWSGPPGRLTRRLAAAGLPRVALRSVPAGVRS